MATKACIAGRVGTSMMEHFFKSIQGWAIYRPLYQEAVEKAPQTGARFVELGSWKGRSTAYMAVEIINSGKQIEFWAVDHWQGSREHANYQAVRDGSLFEEFRSNIEPVADYVKVLRAYSVDAACTFENESIDFLMIDASHEFEDVLADIEAWWPKIKPRGIMAGDDYNWPGVKKAVREFFGKRSIESLIDGSCWRVRK
jgi:predicted O-methyltransferase YrrM